jgi:hypothetical protein
LTRAADGFGAETMPTIIARAAAVGNNMRMSIPYGYSALNRLWKTFDADYGDDASQNDRRQARIQRLTGAGAEGAAKGVAAKGLTVGRGAGAAPVVVGELKEGGALAVVEIGLVYP